MLPYDLTPQAESDIRNIIRYTVERHGVAQALRYKNALEEKFQAIAERTAFSRTLSDRLPHVFVTRCEHHYVFYLAPENKPPQIIAVLHERMDMVSWLASRIDL